MSLIMPEVAKFKTKLPSSGKQVTFRPFTVKEEKFLLLEKETGKSPEFVIENLIKSCVDVKYQNLTQLDIEWLFIQLRIKSVAEEIDVNFRCTNSGEEGKKCGALISEYIDLNDVSIQGDIKYSFKIKFPNGNYTLFFRLPSASDDPITELENIYSRLEMIEQPDGTFVQKEDLKIDDLEEFLSRFSIADYQSLIEKIKNECSLYYKLKLKCPVCENETEIELKTLEDFFT